MKIMNLVRALFAAICLSGWCAAQNVESSKSVPLFDGKTLNGWIQYENPSAPFSSADFKDLPALAEKLSGGADAVSLFLRSQLDEVTKQSLATNSPTGDGAKKLAAIDGAIAIVSLAQTSDGAVWAGAMPGNSSKAAKSSGR